MSSTSLIGGAVDDDHATHVGGVLARRWPTPITLALRVVDAESPRAVLAGDLADGRVDSHSGESAHQQFEELRSAAGCLPAGRRSEESNRMPACLVEDRRPAPGKPTSGVYRWRGSSAALGKSGPDGIAFAERQHPPR